MIPNGRYVVSRMNLSTREPFVVRRTDSLPLAQSCAAQYAGWARDTWTGKIYVPSIGAWCDLEGSPEAYDRLAEAVRTADCRLQQDETTGSWLLRKRSAP
jgi:hypothetical protein